MWSHREFREFGNVVIAALFLFGCDRGIPIDPHSQIIGCYRPLDIDVSAIEDFQIKFEDVDPRTTPFEIWSGSQFATSGTLKLRPELYERGNSAVLITAFRRIEDGTADWATSPCEISRRTEWRSGIKQSQVRGKLVSKIEGRETCEASPGDYELRFYCLQENSAANIEPVVHFIGTGRMKVLPPRAEAPQ